MNRKKLKILLSLFAFNSIYLYFFSSSDHHLFIHHKLLPGNHKESPANPKTPPGKHPHFPITPRAKPWPILPSYLPWSLNPTVALRSCEGYFGNGFTRRIGLRRSSVERESGISGGGGWFRCWHSGTLQSSVCEGGRVRMTPERIQMSIGGERLENVIGRKEEEELPEFEAGAFEVDAGERFGDQRKLVDEEFLNRFVPQGAISRHTMRGLLDSIRLVGSSEFKCDQMAELSKLIWELKLILYGSGENEPVAEACAELTQEFFKENTLRLLIIFLRKLNLEELLTRHKSTVAEFLKWNYDWFFAEYNTKLLESENYVTRRQGVKEPSKTIQIEAFHVFKLFVANKNKPDDIINILVANRTKLLFFFSNFKIDGENDGFEEDKAHVVKEIAELQPK